MASGCVWLGYNLSPAAYPGEGHGNGSVRHKNLGFTLNQGGKAPGEGSPYRSQISVFEQ
jgi:hypothetical protein